MLLEHFPSSQITLGLEKHGRPNDISEKDSDLSLDGILAAAVWPLGGRQAMGRMVL